jgi:5-methylthioribose kinase
VSPAVIPSELLPRLRAAGLLATDAATVRPLPGGVSSEIHLVEGHGARFVVKAALAKLRVRDDWFADISRNRVEQAWFDYAAPIVPGAVPRILGGDAAQGWFAMGRTDRVGP